jgi:hypothetical protein
VGPFGRVQAGGAFPEPSTISESSCHTNSCFLWLEKALNCVFFPDAFINDVLWCPWMANVILLPSDMKKDLQNIQV